MFRKCDASKIWRTTAASDHHDHVGELISQMPGQRKFAEVQPEQDQYYVDTSGAARRKRKHMQEKVMHCNARHSGHIHECIFNMLLPTLMLCSATCMKRSVALFTLPPDTDCPLSVVFELILVAEEVPTDPRGSHLRSTGTTSVLQGMTKRFLVF